MNGPGLFLGCISLETTYPSRSMQSNSTLHCSIYHENAQEHGSTGVQNVVATVSLQIHSDPCIRELLLWISTQCGLVHRRPYV